MIFKKIKLKSFSLVELLVVFSIIGILSVGYLVATQPVRERAKITGLLVKEKQFHNALIENGENVGWWSFDEGSGNNAFDYSGYNNHGTIYGATYTDETPYKIIGQAGGKRALSFDINYDDYVQIPHSEIQNTVFGTSTIFTLAAWVYPKVWYSYPAVINKATCTNWSCTTNGMWATNEAGFCCVMGSNVAGNPGGSCIRVCNKPSAGNWYHVVCTADGTYLKMYINGALKGSDLISKITYPRSANTAPIILGRRTIGGGPSLYGFIDEVRIYSSALTAMQIKTLYYAGLNKLLAKGEISQEEYQQILAKK